MTRKDCWCLLNRKYLILFSRSIVNTGLLVTRGATSDDGVTLESGLYVHNVNLSQSRLNVNVTLIAPMPHLMLS